MKDNQFYPTPISLAIRAKGKFKNKNIVRILDPSAGRGDLVAPFITGHYSRTPERIDCIEIDLSNQAILRDKKLRVIDGDFMQFDGAALYSHIIMNPPFNAGAEHTLKAWDLLVDGELVSIVNAETVKNPYSAQRKRLINIIEASGGAVEFIDQAFMDPDTQRKTNVEVALIWIEKKADLKHNFTHGLHVESPVGIEREAKQELAIKGSSISNAIAVFNAAVASLRAAELAQEEANYYSRLLGQAINQPKDVEVVAGELQERFNGSYNSLKKKAWSNVLNSTEFSKYLSSKAYQKLHADFEAVSQLSFTESNIRGFLLGLVNSQTDMNMQMLLDCFDEITKYIPENRAYYRGWKSNSRHKEQAFRVQMTRFILPNVRSYGFLSWEAKQKLADFDKTFAMLDGKANCLVSLYDLFEDSTALTQLSKGERLSTDYFDVRYYPGVGTIHFFPTNKVVIDRLNRLVGKERQWLPADDAQASKAFWKQFEDAEKVTRAMVMPKTRYYDKPTDEQLMESHLAACEKLKLDTSIMLEAA